MSGAANDRQKLAEFQRLQQRLRAIPRPTIGDMVALGCTFSFAGRLSNPFGAWHCPACWMDYANRGQYRTTHATHLPPTQTAQP